MKTIKQIITFSLHILVVMVCNAQNVNNTLQIHQTDTLIRQKTSIKLYYRTGELKEIRRVIDGELNGSWKYFYTNGQLKKEGVFMSDQTHGTWKTYDQKGRLIFVENYNKGIEDGAWKAFYPDGMMKIEGTFVNGKRQGQWKAYNNLGVLEKIVTFENDMKKNEIILDTKSIDLNFFSINQSISNY